MGINFVERLQRETGATPSFVFRCYSIAQSIYNTEALWQQIEALDYQVAPTIQQKMMLQLYFLVRRSTRWFIRNRKPSINIENTIQDFEKPIKELNKNLSKLLPPSDLLTLETEFKSLVDQAVPEPIARNIANYNILFTSLDIVEGARKKDLPLLDVAKVYYSLGGTFELNWMRNQMNLYSIDNQWDELARSRYRDDLDRIQRKLSTSVLSSKIKRKSVDEYIEAWFAKHKLLIDRYKNMLAEIKSNANVGFVTYSVILRELLDLSQL
jgi:glutamate dehydrogenase